MAGVRTCAACGRNSGPKHARCMYCGGELPALDASAEGPEEPTLDPAALALLAVPPRVTEPKSARLRPKKDAGIDLATLDAPPAPKTWAEALVRGGGPFGNREVAARIVLLPDPAYRPKIPWLKHRVAAAAGTDLYSAVQALTRDVPRTLATFESEADARAAEAHLLEGGLNAVVLLRSWIEAWPGPDEVTAISSRDAGGMVFRRRAGDERRVAKDSVRGAMLARIEPGPTERAGGGVLGRSGGSYMAIDLLLRDEDSPVRVRSDLFDFQTLGEGVGISAYVNLLRLVAELAPPGGDPLEVDDRFKRVPHFPALARQGDGAEPPRFLRRELEFAEYGLVMDLALDR